MLSSTELLEGFVESGFLTLCALIAPLAYLVPLDVQKCLPRAPTPGDASDNGAEAQRGGLNSITATSFCQRVLSEMNAPIFIPEASRLAERQAHPLESPSQEAANSTCDSTVSVRALSGY